MRPVLIPRFMCTFHSILVFLLFTPMAAHALTRVNLLILSNILEAQDLNAFARQKGLEFKVDVVFSPLDVEARLRANPKGYDAVLCSERVLQRLAHARLIRPLSESPSGVNDRHPPHEGQPLWEPSSSDDYVARSLIPFMVDPLGVAWWEETLPSEALPLSWRQLLPGEAPPQWRGKVAAPSSLKTRMAIATLAASTEELPRWMIQFQKSVQSSDGNVLTLLGSRKAHAVVTWQSQWRTLTRTLPKVKFGVPRQGTWFDRISFAAVTDTNKEAILQEFTKWAQGRTAEWAKKAQLVPLDSESEVIQGWRFYREDLPWPKGLEQELTKLITD